MQALDSYRREGVLSAFSREVLSTNSTSPESDLIVYNFNTEIFSLLLGYIALGAKSREDIFSYPP